MNNLFYSDRAKNILDTIARETGLDDIIAKFSHLPPIGNEFHRAGGLTLQPVKVDLDFGLHR